MEHTLSVFFRGELTTLGWIGIGVAAFLILATRIMLPQHERGRVRMPLLFLLLHLAVVLGRGFLSEASPAQRPLTVIGVLVLGLSIGRSAFLLLIDHLLGRKLTYPLPRIIRDILQGLIYVAVAMFTLRAAGVEPGSLLTTSALLTALIGLSMQDTLGNMFAGLSIQIQRPFEVGDWIRFDSDREHTGRVVEINWRATKVQTTDQVEVTVPNGVLAKAPIQNFTKPSNVVRRMVSVQAPYEVPPGQVQELILEGLTELSGVLRKPAASVVTSGFMDSGIEYWVRFFIADFRDRDEVAGQVRDRIWYVFNRAGISIPFPIRTVHLHEAEATAQQDKEGRQARRERILGCVDFIAALPPEALELLAARSVVRRYGRGEIIIEQDHEGDELFIIDRGEVVVSHAGLGETPVEVARLGPTQFFGEMSLTTGERRTATVRALRECELLVVGKTALHEVLARSPNLAQTISEIVAERQVLLEESATQSQRDSEVIVEEKKSVLLRKIRAFFKL
jgi:small-conductance mechanosensitive channel